MVKSAAQVVTASVLAFASTTIDDFVVIVFFMSRAEKRFSKLKASHKNASTSRSREYMSIASGVFLGFTVLIILSLLGRVFTFLDMGYICLLGFIPILIGSSQAAGYVKEYMQKSGYGESYNAFVMKWCRCNGVLDWLWTCCGSCEVLVEKEDSEDSEHGNGNGGGTKKENDEDRHDQNDVKENSDGAGLYAQVRTRDMDSSRSPRRQIERRELALSEVDAVEEGSGGGGGGEVRGKNKVSAKVEKGSISPASPAARSRKTSNSGTMAADGPLGKYAAAPNDIEVGGTVFSSIESRPEKALTSIDVVSNPIVQSSMSMSISSGDANHLDATASDDADPNNDNNDDDDDGGEEEDALEDAASESSPIKTAFRVICQWILSPMVLEVALIMIGVGGDNIAIYMVLFATSKPEHVILTIVIFYGLLVMNLLLAAWLMRCKSVALCFQEYMEGFVPLVLIGLGCFIVYDSVLFGHDGLT